MTFWIALLALTLFAVGLTVGPLLLGGRNRTTTEESAELAVLRDRREEIDQELQAGRLTDTQAKAAHQELVDTLTARLSTPSAHRDGVNQSRVTLAACVLLVISIPVVSYLTYAMVGQPNITEHLARYQNNGTGGPVSAPGPEQIAAMAEDLTARTQSHPDDGQAWLMLAQARKFQGQFGNAVTAFERAVALGNFDAGVLADYAEAIALTRERRFDGKPQEILERAFKLDPQHIKVNALLGASYFQAGRHQEALPFLRRFVAHLDPQSDQATQINRLIAGIQGQAGADQQATAAANTSAGSERRGADTAPSPGLIRGSVDLAGAAPAPGATLFISARLATGPRMPFAAIRLPASELPVQFELSDANAMSPNRLLSGAGQVVVEARISQSGQAMRQSGDRYGVSQVVTPGNATVSIEIDKTVP